MSSRRVCAAYRSAPTRAALTTRGADQALESSVSPPWANYTPGRLRHYGRLCWYARADRPPGTLCYRAGAAGRGAARRNQRCPRGFRPTTDRVQPEPGFRRSRRGSSPGACRSGSALPSPRPQPANACFRICRCLGKKIRRCTIRPRLYCVGRRDRAYDAARCGLRRERAGARGADGRGSGTRAPWVRYRAPIYGRSAVRLAGGDTTRAVIMFATITHSGMPRREP